MNIDPEKTRSVAVFAPLYPPAFRGGGPIRSIAALAANSPGDLLPLVVTADSDLGADARLAVTTGTWTQRGRAEVYYADSRSLWRLMQAFLASRRRRPAMLHFNSFFNPRFTIAPLLLWKAGLWGRRTPVLLSPRGEFGFGALQRRSFKKNAYVRLFRLFMLHKDVIWHSTAAHETADIRRIWGGSVQIVERENDTLLPRQAMEASGPPRDTLRAVFLGRLVEHKGLQILLAALRHVPEGMTLDVFGSREDDAYARVCEEYAAALPEHIQVAFRGELDPDRVVCTLNEYDALLLPTAGENFGHVIAEAMAASCIVTTTPYTPWTEILNSGGGVIVPDRSDTAWGSAIHTLASEDPTARQARRQKIAHAYNSWAARAPSPNVWTTALSLFRNESPAESLPIEAGPQ